MKFWIDKAEIKENLKLAFPIVLTQVGNASMGLVDTLVVGKTNATELAAVAAGNSVFWTLVMISSGLLFGLDTLISQAFGRRDFKLGDRILVQGLWISLFISIIVKNSFTVKLLKFVTIFISSWISLCALFNPTIICKILSSLK